MTALDPEISDGPPVVKTRGCQRYLERIRKISSSEIGNANPWRQADADSGES